MGSSTETLEALTRRAARVGAPVMSGAAPAERLLPVAAPLADLLPWGGLRRGETVAVAGSTSLALALLARASAAGAWCVVVGAPALGLAAAGEAGLELQRLALVPHPGRDWPAVVAALLDAFDVVALRPPERLRPRDAGRLQARARERGTVLVTLHDDAAAAGLDAGQLRLSVVSRRWKGVGDGHGHLAARLVEVRAEGRGAAARPRTRWLWLPAVDAPVAAAGDVTAATTGRDHAEAV